MAMTAQLPTTSYSGGTILKFDKVNFSIGVNNLTEYKSTGKFLCERKGLYMISSSIMADTSGDYYFIYLNGNVISKTYIVYNSNSPSTMRYTGTVVLAQQLLPNDSVWVYMFGSGAVYGDQLSTFTILKIK